MQAIGTGEYGSPDALELLGIAGPALDDDGVLVRVRAAAVNPYDWHLTRGLPYLVRASEGFRRPKRAVRGVDMAGHVEAVGQNGTHGQPGDEAFGWGRFRALAEDCACAED